MMFQTLTIQNRIFKVDTKFDIDVIAINKKAV